MEDKYIEWFSNHSKEIMGWSKPEATEAAFIAGCDTTLKEIKGQNLTAHNKKSVLCPVSHCANALCSCGVVPKECADA